MPVGQLEQTVRRLRRLVGDDACSLSDHLLLTQYAASRDEAAFAILVERHAAMVQGVCRRVLAHNQDAEDACQAAFLVLARKAGSIRKRESLRCWLHGVAFRVASNLRKQRSRRPAGPLVDSAAPPVDISWREAQRILDEELLRLPESLRLPLMLCYLEGKTRDEAAEELGWSTTTFRGRLERGRERLRDRLERRGVGLTAGLLATLLSSAGTANALSSMAIDELVRSTAAGQTSSPVRLLAEGAMRTMSANTFKMTLAVLVSAGLLGAGIALFHEGTPAIMLPVAAANEADKDLPPKKDSPAKPLSEKELSATAAKCRDAAVEWLKKNQDKDGLWEKHGSTAIAMNGGVTSLAIAALIDGGVKANDPALARALKYLRELKPTGTYIVALQTLALCKVNDKRDADIIARNVEWLVRAGTSRNANNPLSWSYTIESAGDGDFSNTQFALMALHEAGRVGIKPNKKFWESVRSMCLASQAADGGWGYRGGENRSTFAMSCAGLNGLYLADENIGADTADTRKAKKNASIYLARSYRPFDGISAFYNLDLIARLGKLSGENKIGDRDWYREGVDWILKNQNADGSIVGNSAIDKVKPLSTAYGILFLGADPGKN